MFKKYILLLLIALFLQSCGSAKKVTSSVSKNDPNKPTLVDKVIWSAVAYKGVPYKFGGTTKQGMDCSGLIYISFKERDIVFPRTTKTMFTQGEKVPLNEVIRGDLLFFKTQKTKNKVNHVGLVTSVKKGDIKFIHASTSRGVMVSSLNESYWKKRFVKAKRVL